MRVRFTDATARNAKPTGRPYRVGVGEALWLRVGATGGKSWELRSKMLPGGTASLGRYPALSVAAARDKARAILAGGVAEGMTYAQQKRVRTASAKADAAMTFGSVRKEWSAHEAIESRWTDAYANDVRASFDNHLASLDPLPIGSIIARITAPLIAKARRVQKRDGVSLGGPLAGVNVERRLHSVMNFAVTKGYIERNPIPPRSRKTRSARHLAAVTDHQKVGELLRKADATDCSRGVRRAHGMLVFTCQRISEIVNATWSEFDLARATWTIPRDRMKVRGAERPEHTVPIPSRLLARMKQWQRETESECIYVCPARDGDGPLTVEAVEKHYRRSLELVGVHSPHSWRSVLCTWAGDAGKDTDLAELQLDHLIGNSVAQSYNRSQRLELRRELMQWFEDSLIAARDGAEVVPIGQRSTS